MQQEGKAIRLIAVAAVVAVAGEVEAEEGQEREPGGTAWNALIAWMIHGSRTPEPSNAPKTRRAARSFGGV
jgi:hypothetical protein